MNRYALLAAIWFLGISIFAQDAASRAAAIAAQQEAAERDRLINSAIQDLQRTVARQQSDINDLKNRNESLVRQMNDMNAKFREALGSTVTQKQLEKLVESLKEVDRNRLSDRNLFIEQIKQIKDIASRPAPAPIIITNTVTRVEPRIEKEKEKEKEDEPVLTNPNGYYSYTVKPKDNLSAIVAAYNAEFKKDGKATITIDQVKKANPKINPNNIPVGKTLQIPIPSDK
jgi:hypothetical protein